MTGVSSGRYVWLKVGEPAEFCRYVGGFPELVSGRFLGEQAGMFQVESADGVRELPIDEWMWVTS